MVILMAVHAIWFTYAPATFSRLVSKVLGGLERFAIAYLDDIIILVIYGKTI